MGVVPQLHVIVKVSRSVVPPHVQDVDKTVVIPGNSIELENPLVCTLVWPVELKIPAEDNLYRPVSARDGARQPDLAISAAADDADQLVLRQLQETLSSLGALQFMTW